MDMKSVTEKNKTLISVIIFISIVCCALFGLQTKSDFTNNSNKHSAQSSSYTFNIDNLVEFINAEELTSSASHISLIRQDESKKINIHVFGINLVAGAALLQLLFAIFILYHIYSDNIRDSHRCILDYIHSIDGKKA